MQLQHIGMSPLFTLIQRSVPLSKIGGKFRLASQLIGGDQSREQNLVGFWQLVVGLS